MSSVRTETLDGGVAVITIDRPQVRNAVDAATAAALLDAVRDLAASPDVAVGVLTGSDGTFCAGADLHEVASGGRPVPSAEGELAPMGPTWLTIDKPVIAAIEGHAVAGGLELALWCDLRVAARDAVLGVFCRRFGVPLIDGGTVRLPRLIGQSRALDLILTGRAVGAEEALAIGLVNRLAEPGAALGAAVELARSLAALPQTCLRGDRASVLEQWTLDDAGARANELRHGMRSLAGGAAEGARRFAGGAGRHGSA